MSITGFQPRQRHGPLQRHAGFGEAAELPAQTTQDVPENAQLRDRFGLGPPFFEYPDQSREWIALALDYLGLSKDVNPRPFGTAAEMAVFGALLDAGLHHYVGPEPGEGTFVFQSFELGGRQPGGAVVDFVLFYQGAQIGVRVQSVFHAPSSPFGNGAGDLREREQENRLLGVGFERVVNVNEPIRNFPIENGPDEMARQELDRILGRWAA